MSQGSAIEWTDSTWNPTTGCRKVSPGCDNCYAATLAKRLKAMGNARYQNDGPDGPGFGLTLHWDKITEPLTWRKPRRVFVNSMSDLFHPSVPADFLLQCFRVMTEASAHQFQVLTKRPTYMARIVPAIIAELGLEEPPPNIWLGTSVEDQEWADKRIPPLVETPAAVRFLSCEPLLGPVNLTMHLDRLRAATSAVAIECEHGYDGCPKCDENRIHWVIVGGESGPNHRPFKLEWARSLQRQCSSAGVPFFFKQVGGRTPKAGGRDLDGKTYSEFPKVSSDFAVPA
jgi:protein gp37